MRRAILSLLLGLSLAGAEHKAVFPPGVKPVGPYSPGVVAGGMLYVSGQGARDANNQLPNGPEAQIRQCLENVKAVLSAESLSMQHVVSAAVYLADIQNYDTLNRVWTAYFPKDAPARTVTGVTRMPTETPVEIAVTAVVNLRQKKVIRIRGVKLQEPASPAVQVGDRVFLTGGIGPELAGKLPADPGAQVKIVMDGAERALRQAGLELRHLAYANIYVDPKMPMQQLGAALDEYIPDETSRTLIQTASLPFGAHIQVSGIASRQMKRVGGHCATVGDTVYCSGRSGTIRQVMESLQADLKVSGLDLHNAVAANVYIDDLDEFAAMNKIYAGFFGKINPTRTTVQPWKKVAELSLPPTTGVVTKGDDSPRAQVSVVVVR